MGMGSGLGLGISGMVILSCLGIWPGMGIRSRLGAKTATSGISWLCSSFETGCHSPRCPKSGMVEQYASGRKL